MNEGIYYLRLNGKVEGPYTIGQIYDAWAARKINSQTPFARFEEMEKWQPLSELTLKISAPKTLSPKNSTPESAVSPPNKQRIAPPAEAEEYVPQTVYPRQAKAPPVQDTNEFWRGLPKRVFFNFSVSSGICITTGVILALVCLILSSGSPDGKEIRQDLLIFKQNGAIAGTGLILMGGLLLVARQITQILVVMKGPPSEKGDRKPSQTS